MNAKYPVMVGTACGAIGLALALTGYGCVAFYMRLLIWIGFAVLALPALFRRQIFQYCLHVIIITGIATGFWYGGTAIRRFQKSLVRDELNPLVNQVKDFHERNGHYPERLDELHFSTQLSLKAADFKEGDVNLDGMNTHDAVVYLGTNGFTIIVPVTKLLSMSITRFYAFIWTSQDSKWRYDYMIWTIGEIR